MLSRAAWVLLLLTGCPTDYDLTDKGDPNDLDEDDEDITDPDEDETVPEGNGGVTGRVCSPSEASYVAGASVWVELENGDRVATETDADGRFTLEGLPEGEHVVHVEIGSFSSEYTVEIEDGEITEIAEEECVAITADDVNIAVVTGQYDSIGAVLDHLGFEYTTINGISGNAHKNLLLDPAELENYDIIFFNCGMNDNWTTDKNTIKNNLRDYVANGGSVYTSDWAYFLTEVTYPDMIDFFGDDTQNGPAHVGEAQSVNATVLDANMISVLGTNNATLNYDLPSWAAPDGVGTGTTLIRGSYSYFDYYGSWSSGTINSAPLAVRQSDGEGQMLFTSFHNEQQTTLDMDVLLEAIILSL